MTRKYTQKKRAEQQAETRARIVAAAVDLHGTVGPAHTTVTMVAERAGVQRHTFYKHFPDERSLLMACSGHTVERDPLPDASSWQALNDREARLRTGLTELYDWYARNADLTARVARDAQHHALTREVTELRIGKKIAGYADILGAGLGPLARAALHLALGFPAWSALAREAGLSQPEAVMVMVRAVLAAEGDQSSPGRP